MTIKNPDSIAKFETLVLTATNELGSTSYTFGIIRPSGVLMTLIAVSVIGGLIFSGMAIMLTVLHVQRRRKQQTQRNGVLKLNSPQKS